jgi:CheY-like chemotaxis protein
MRKPLIIVTDDEPWILEMYQRALSNMFGASVIVTTDSAQALELAVRKIPDLFITDLVKPGIGGVELIERLRENPQTECIPIWVISGQVNTEAGRRAKNAGADQVISKPFTLDTLVAHGNQLFNIKRTGRFDYLFEAGTETQDLDYKEKLDRSRDGFATVAKDIIAMANFGGGYLLFGVAEKSKGHFELVGLPPEQLEQLEVTTLNKAIREYTDPPHPVKSHRVHKNGLSFVVVEVPASAAALVLAKKQNDAARLYPGRIYSRTTSCESAEVRDNHELRRIFARFFKRQNEG